MDIKLIPEKGSKFVFPALPEKINGKQAMRHQSFDIISQGKVKIPRGTEVTEISWEGEFFGEKLKNSAVVKKNNWKDPAECIDILTQYMENEMVLNLIVTESWINMDVTISSFAPLLYGAFGNVKYSITFIQKKPLEIYTTKELKTKGKKTKMRQRASSIKTERTYTVVKGDTLWSIAAKRMGSGAKWETIYNANKGVIEAAAKKRGEKSSDHGHWIYPGEVLVIPARQR